MRETERGRMAGRAMAASVGLLSILAGCVTFVPEEEPRAAAAPLQVLAYPALRPMVPTPMEAECPRLSFAAEPGLLRAGEALAMRVVLENCSERSVRVPSDAACSWAILPWISTGGPPRATERGLSVALRSDACRPGSDRIVAPGQSASWTASWDGAVRTPEAYAIKFRLHAALVHASNSSALDMEQLVSFEETATVMVGRTLAEGRHSGIGAMLRATLESQEELEALWTLHLARNLCGDGTRDCLPPPPEVDWSRERVVAVYRGNQPDSCHGILVEDVRRAENGTLVDVLSWDLRSPRHACFTAITQPFVLLAIPDDGTPVDFRERSQTVQAPPRVAASR